MISRTDGLRICRQEADKINNLLIQCLVYKNSTYDYTRWIDQIAESLSTINNLRINAQQTKLRTRDLKTCLFRICCDKVSSTEASLRSFCSVKSVSLPYFIVTFDLVKSLYALYSEFEEAFIDILSKPNKLNQIDFYNTLYAILDKYN